MKALRPPPAASPVTYLFRFRCPRDSSLNSCSLLSALPSGWRSRARPGSLFTRRSPLPARSHVDVSGTSQVPRRPLLRLCPALRPRPNRRTLANDGLVGAAPAREKAKAPACWISGLPRGFSTCCLRFTGDVATARARLASGWLAGLFREGVEPSGPLRKVSELYIPFPLSWIDPDATHVPYKSQVELRAVYMPDAARAVSGHLPS
jgi:hypothetical protein